MPPSPAANAESALVASNLFKNPALANRKLELPLLNQALAASGGVFALSLMRGAPAAAHTSGRGRPSDGAGSCVNAAADADVSCLPAAPATAATAVTATSAAATSPGSDEDHPAVGTVTITTAPTPTAGPKTLMVSAERVWVRLEPSALWRFIPMLHELHPGDCLRFNDPRGALVPHVSHPLPLGGGTSRKLGPGFTSGDSGEMTVQELPGGTGLRLRRQLQQASSVGTGHGTLVAVAANGSPSHAAVPCALLLSVLLKALDALFPVPRAVPKVACQAQGYQVHQGQGQEVGQQGAEAGGAGNAVCFSMAGGARQQLCDSSQQAWQQLQGQSGAAAAEAGEEACAGAEAAGSDQGAVTAAASGAAVDPRQHALLCNLSARAILQAFAAAAEERHRKQFAAAAAAAAARAGASVTAGLDQHLVACTTPEGGANASTSALFSSAGCSLPAAITASLPWEASLPNPPTLAPAASTTSATPAPSAIRTPSNLSPARGGPADLSALCPNLLISRPKLDHFLLPASAVAATVQRTLQRSPSPSDQNLAAQAMAVVPALLAACPCSAFVCRPADQSAAVDVCLNTQVSAGEGRGYMM